MTKTKLTAHERRERRVAAFKRWLIEHEACPQGMRFARGLTVHEAWAKSKESHQSFVSWFVDESGVSFMCMACCCTRPEDFMERKALIKLPRTFDWERLAKRKEAK